MSEESLKYKIGLSLIPKIGDVTAKKLVAYTGSVEAVFNEKKRNLEKIPGIGPVLAKSIEKQNILVKAEQEVEKVIKNNINILFYLDDNFPERLKHCTDSPILLFRKGECDLNSNKILSIVGTRNATNYGKEICEKLIKELKEKGHNVLIISGLAYGIDICAHKAALNNCIETIAVLGHGLGMIYPAAHRATAKKIEEKGCLLTEFLYDDQPEPPNFVKRNRIVAGLADATIVIESGTKGGALITADIANSYNRDVFAVPGNVNSTWSNGCNKLIKSNKAALLESADDIEYLLGWDAQKPKNGVVQRELFHTLSREEQLIVDSIKEEGQTPIDHIFLTTQLPVSKVSALLLNLEFAGIVKSLPGKIYKII